MISFIKGKLVDAQPTVAVVDVGGIGFEVNISLGTFEKLPDVGQNVELLIHFQVREDQFALFGFALKEEKDLFRLLIGVSKIGPKLAMAILSGMPLVELKNALITGDAKRISLIPGVGKKTAERLIVELREKIQQTSVFVGGEDKLNERQKTLISDAMVALISLGYAQAKAQDAVRKAIKGRDIGNMAIEELVKLALKNAHIR